MALHISPDRPTPHLKSWKFRHLEQDQESYIYPHVHCAKCDALIEKGYEYSKAPITQKNYPGWDYYCSKQCADSVMIKQKSQKKWRYIMYILFAILPILVILVLFVF